jgi:hypothetical protein
MMTPEEYKAIVLESHATGKRIEARGLWMERHCRRMAVVALFEAAMLAAILTTLWIK